MVAPKSIEPVSEVRLPSTAGRLPDLLSSVQWTALTMRLGLSTRQAQVLRYAFYDERDSAIAKSLGVSEHTVHTYRIRLFRKLGATSMSQAIAIAATSCFELRLILEERSVSPSHLQSASPANTVRPSAAARVGDP